MIFSVRTFLLIAMILMFNHSLAEISDFNNWPILKGNHLGQTPPGNEPQKFLAGILSTQNGELAINSVFSPDGKEFFYVIFDEVTERYNLMFTNIYNGVWTRPIRLPLAENYSVADIALSPDGNRLYFCSEMPSIWPSAEGFDIWFVERTEDGWSTPVNAGNKINTPKGETQPSFTNDGTMYFPSFRNNSNGNSVDIYYSKYLNGKFLDPVPISTNINTIYSEGNLFISPDSRYILFYRWGMPKSIDGGKGLYISFQQNDGSWSKAIKTEFRGSLAGLSHDGKYLFYSTNDGIHWVDVKILEKYKLQDETD